MLFRSLLGQRRLGHIEAPGRAPEVLLLGNRQKEPQMTDESEVNHGRSIGLAYQILQLFGIYISHSRLESIVSQPLRCTVMTQNSPLDRLTATNDATVMQQLTQGASTLELMGLTQWRKAL